MESKISTVFFFFFLLEHYILMMHSWESKFCIIQASPNQTWISGSATTYCFKSLSPNARETASTPPTLQVPTQNLEGFYCITWKLGQKIIRNNRQCQVCVNVGHMEGRGQTRLCKTSLPAHITNPPASSIRCRSSVWSGLWSRDTAMATERDKMRQTNEKIYIFSAYLAFCLFF